MRRYEVLSVVSTKTGHFIGWWSLTGNTPGDIGVLSPLIFNLMELGPGEAIYIPAGELHAYLRGVGMELMANSDNVLRGGLDPKTCGCSRTP